MEVVDDESEEKVVGGAVDIHFGGHYVSPIPPYIYIFGPGLNSQWPDNNSSTGSSSLYTSLNQTLATTSAGPDFNGGHLGNSQLHDGNYESDDVIAAVHSASTSTISSHVANTVICMVLGLGHKTHFSMEA